MRRSASGRSKCASASWGCVTVRNFGGSHRKKNLLLKVKFTIKNYKHPTVLVKESNLIWALKGENQLGPGHRKRHPCQTRLGGQTSRKPAAELIRKSTSPRARQGQGQTIDVKCHSDPFFQWLLLSYQIPRALCYTFLFLGYPVAKPPLAHGNL